jgi:hypothetical protein
MRGITLLIAGILLFTSLSAVVAQRIVPPGQVGKTDLPQGQIRRQLTYGHLKDWLPFVTAILGCIFTLPCCGLGGPLCYVLGNALIKPGAFN